MNACTLAACVLLIGGPVQTIGSGPARVEIARSPQGLAVTYHNAVVKSLYVEMWSVELDGVTVAGTINSGDYMVPDDLIVTPPLGYWCDPCRITVEENEAGTVLLYPEVGA